MGKHLGAEADAENGLVRLDRLFEKGGFPGQVGYFAIS